MKKLLLFCLAIGLPVLSAGQDMYSTRQLTFDHAQNGFVTWAPDGKSLLVALMDRQTRRSTIERVSVYGKERTQIPCQPDNFYRHLALSPDGSLLVFGEVNGRYAGLYVMSSDGGPALPG